MNNNSIFFGVNPDEKTRNFALYPGVPWFFPAVFDCTGKRRQEDLHRHSGKLQLLAQGQSLPSSTLVRWDHHDVLRGDDQPQRWDNEVHY